MVPAHGLISFIFGFCLLVAPFSGCRFFSVFFGFAQHCTNSQPHFLVPVFHILPNTPSSLFQCVGTIWFSHRVHLKGVFFNFMKPYDGSHRNPLFLLVSFFSLHTLTHHTPAQTYYYKNGLFRFSKNGRCWRAGVFKPIY